MFAGMVYKVHCLIFVHIQFTPGLLTNKNIFHFIVIYLPSECGWKVTTRRMEDETEIKDFECTQMSDNDLRMKLNKNR